MRRCLAVAVACAVRGSVASWCPMAGPVAPMPPTVAELARSWLLPASCAARSAGPSGASLRWFTRHAGTRIAAAPGHQRDACLGWPLPRLLEPGAGRAGPPCSRVPGLFRSGAGVGLAVGRLQALGGDVGVDLRGGRRGVAEDLLHAAQVGAALKQVRGGGVPDGVRARVPARRPPASRAAVVADRAWPRARSGRSRACTMRRAVLGSSLPPRAPRKSAVPLRSLARTGRPASSQRASARIAGRPTGTTRSLPPLPRTRTVRRSPSSPPVSSSHSSLTRIAVAYSSSRTAASRMARAAAVRWPRGGLAQRAVLAVREHPVHLVPAQHLRQHPPRLGGAELRPRVGGEPALAARVGGEGAGRRAPAGQRGPGGAGLMLARQPAPERGQVERGGVPDAGAAGVLEERLDVALVGADGVPRQGALGGQVAAELRQRRAQRGGQALGRTVRFGSRAASHHHGHSVHRPGAVGKRPGRQCLSLFCQGCLRGRRRRPRIGG